MKEFTYERAASPAGAAEAAARTPGTKFIAGGTNLLDLMKGGIEMPAQQAGKIMNHITKLLAIHVLGLIH